MVERVLVVGGGHNGLVAATYLARAGHDVTVLERLPETGGATVSERVFRGVDARLSRYSYLVSLFPRRVADDLGLDLELRRRRYASYTPQPGTDRGLLVDTGDPDATRASFARVGAADDVDAFAAWQRDLGAVADAVWPTMTDPLPTASAVRAAVGERLWRDLVERPVGETIRERFASDLVRGVVATDALIGTFASLADPGLQQNVCLLYHVVGGGTGDWDVPVGGMGALSGALAAAARAAGVRIRTGVEVLAVDPAGAVTVRDGDGVREERADAVLVNAAPAELDRLLPGGFPHPPAEGAQVKVNMLLTRLPRLRDDAVPPEAAFGGTFHANEGLEQLEAAHRAATSGALPDPVPVETYCHSLTDPSILGPALQDAGAQTMTAFALQVPHRLAVDRAAAERAVLDSLESVLAEPVEPLLWRDADGRPCIETRTTHDLEAELRLPGGSIFHGPLSWPWAADRDPLASAAERWGVATGHERVLLCGSGSRRGGAVSGLGGYAAARALLEG